MPNVYVNAYYFNGYNYQVNSGMSSIVSFDYNKNDLELTTVFDKESYKPGEDCQIKGEL